VSEAKIIQLFPISVYTGDIVINEDDKKNILEENYERMFSGNGDYTKNKYLLHDTKYKNLKEKINNHLDVYTKKYLNVKKHIKFYMQNSWAVRHQSDDWGQSHIHANSLLSGVYYIQTKKNSGDICFHKPMGYTNIFHSSTNVPFEKFDNHNCDVYNITPEDGKILLFPSHLYHSINNNISDITRYSVSFNFHVDAELFSEASKIDYLKLKEFKYE